ncbi:hypothetical protein B0H15DRAFT_847097, partial [Mycena belliarum]
MRQKFALYLFAALSLQARSLIETNNAVLNQRLTQLSMPSFFSLIIFLHCSVKKKSSFDDLAEVAEDSSHYRKFDRTRKVHK